MGERLSRWSLIRMMLLQFLLQACDMQTWKEYKSPADVNTWTCLDMYMRLESTLGL